jgi:hypothetical protein
VCGYHITELTQMTVNECPNFKPKSHFVELPCEVGQTVWFVFRDIFNGRKNSKIVTEKRKIIRIHQNCLKKWAIDTICEPSLGTMTFDLELHLGKNIFFDEEEARLAEKVLKEAYNEK